MRTIVTIGVLTLLLGTGVAAQTDTYEEGKAAYRNGDWRKAASLFTAAAEQESDRLRRAEIRLRLAVTHFALKETGKAEEALALALQDDPNLEVRKEFYGNDFVALYQRVRGREAPAPARTAAPPAGRAGARGRDSLASLRQQLAAAVDNTALDAVLLGIQQLESTAAPTELPALLELKAETLERLGRRADAYECRGRVAALRARETAAPGAEVFPLEAQLEARRLLGNGQAAEAEALMRGVLAVLPSCLPALEVRGEALLEEGKLDAAYTIIRTALDVAPKTELWMNLGEIELRRGRPAAARDAFRAVVDRESGNDRALAALGLTAAILGDRGAAKKALDQALENNGTLFEARVVRAQLAIADGENTAALQHLQRALQVRPDDPWAIGWQGIAYLGAGNLGAASDRLGAAVRAGRSTFSLPYAEVLRRQGKAADALALLATVNPADPEGKLLRARCLLDSGRPAEAIGLLRELVDERPDDARVRYLLGWALYGQRQWQPALDELTRAAAAEDRPAAAEAVDRAEATIAVQRLLDAGEVPVAPPIKN
jgi:tetratricopeptide (TPR) repeat protein